MGALGFGMRVIQSNFIDPEKILDEVKKLEARVLAAGGAYTRRVMKNSIKYADGSAAAGKPPFAHRSKGFTKVKKNRKTGAVARQEQSPLRELIYFARDPATESVVIGPVLFGSGVARVIEEGGATTRTDPLTGLKRAAHTQPHPFAAPALVAAAPKLPDIIRGMVK